MGLEDEKRLKAPRVRHQLNAAGARNGAEAPEERHERLAGGPVGEADDAHGDERILATLRL